MSPKASGNRIKLSRPTLGPEEELAVKRVLRSGRLSMGPEVEAFEDDFCRVTGSRYAVAVSSGTSALQLALHAMGIQAGDEVVVPAYTFVATANAVRNRGAIPVPADVLSDSCNLDPDSLASVAGERTALILPVHQFGRLADMEAIARVSDGTAVLEDAACAAGVAGRPKGLAACFSFRPRKCMTTGEGGMITTQDEHLQGRLRMLRHHGLVGSEAVEAGYNFRMSEVAAAIGRVQLGRLPALLSRREQVANHYAAELGSAGWLELPGSACGVTAHQSYVVRVKDDAPVSRDQLVSHLLSHAIESQAGVMPFHQHAAYRGCNRIPLPVSEKLGKSALFLPMHAELTEADTARVCWAIRSSA